MSVIFYPNEETVKQAKLLDTPLLVLISVDSNSVMVCSSDDSLEHSGLLRNLNMDDSKIDNYFRITVDSDGADWTFVCPRDYRGLLDERVRITRFYDDGWKSITNVLKRLGYNVKIDIPRRFRRHLDKLK